MLEPEQIPLERALKEPFNRQNHGSPVAHVDRFRSKETKNSMEELLTFPQMFVGEEDGEEQMESNLPNHYQNDCPTCQKNWDLLNRNQRHSKTERFPVNKHIERRDILTTPNRPGDPTPTCLSFDLDGLLPSVDRQQVRLRQILASKEVFLSLSNSINCTNM